MVKTTIDIEETIWRDFTIKVIKKYGGRKNNLILTGLIKEFNKNG